MSAEFRLSDEHREALAASVEDGAHYEDDRGLFATVESIVASEIEAARAEWERVWTQNGEHTLAEWREEVSEAAERALVERIEAWITDPVRRIWLDPDDAASLRAALTGPDAEGDASTR